MAKVRLIAEMIISLPKLTLLEGAQLDVRYASARRRDAPRLCLKSYIYRESEVFWFVFGSCDFVWIVPFVQKNKDNPRSHTNQHETPAAKDSAAHFADKTDEKEMSLATR